MEARVWSQPQGAKVDWQLVAQSFPGRTKAREYISPGLRHTKMAEVYDVWRKVVFPKLKRGEPLA